MIEQVELNCPQCGYREECGPAAVVGWLRRARMVRHDQTPDPELLGELLRAARPKLSCPKCGSVGLAARPMEALDDDAWGQSRSCEGCGQRIARERLEAMPDVRLCTACQAREDRGETPQSDEFCPRCGNRMVVRQSRGAGVTRYVSACPQCGRKNG